MKHDLLALNGPHQSHFIKPYLLRYISRIPGHDRTFARLHPAGGRYCYLNSVKHRPAVSAAIIRKIRR